jgi:hypothetical protein
MGSGIAQKMATEGFDVFLIDVDDASVARGLGTIERTLAEAVDRGIMRSDRSAAIRQRIRGSTRYEDLATADLVVEAVFENFALKQEVFRRLEAVCRPDTILATKFSIGERDREGDDASGTRARPALLLPSGEKPARRGHRRSGHGSRTRPSRLGAAGAARQDADCI